MISPEIRIHKSREKEKIERMSIKMKAEGYEPWACSVSDDGLILIVYRNASTKPQTYSNFVD